MAFLEGLDPTGAQWMDYFTSTLQVLGIIFWALLFMGAMVFAWYWLTFNIPAHIYEAIGQSKALRFLKKARARLKTKDDVTKLKVFGVPGTFMPPQSDEYILGRRGKLLNLLRVGNEYKPFVMSSNPGYITVQDHDVRFWTSQSMGSIAKKYTEQSFFQKYGAYMAFIFGMLVLGWMFYTQLKFIQGNLRETTAAAQTLADAIKGKLGAP